MFVLSNLFCLASYGAPLGVLLVMAIPLIILGILVDNANKKALKQGRKKGVRRSKDFFDWMFYSNYRD